jgi:hypothetical protein
MAELGHLFYNKDKDDFNTNILSSAATVHLMQKTSLWQKKKKTLSGLQLLYVYQLATCQFTNRNAHLRTFCIPYNGLQKRSFPQNSSASIFI